MAITQRPLALRRDLIRIFGEDRLVAVIRTTTPGLARDAARAMSEAGVRLVEITLTIPDYFTAGVVGFGVGGPLIRPDLLQRGDVASVIHNAERFLAATRRPATN